jgi:hypothetical protein
VQALRTVIGSLAHEKPTTVSTAILPNPMPVIKKRLTYAEVPASWRRRDRSRKRRGDGRSLFAIFFGTIALHGLSIFSIAASILSRSGIRFFP